MGREIEDETGYDMKMRKVKDLTTKLLEVERTKKMDE